MATTERDSSDEPSFADVLSRAVQARGLSLDRIRARLEAAGVPVSNATLSYWQSGRSLPTRARSLRTLVELEGILDLEPGSLIELIRRTDGRTRHQLFPWQDVLPGEQVAEKIISDLGMEGTGRLSRVSVHDTVTLGENRSEATQLTRMVLRAERSGVQNWPIVIQGDNAEEATPEIETTFGCYVGRSVEVPQHQLLVAEMRLPRPLHRGELAMVEYGIAAPPSQTPSFRLARHCPGPLREIVLAVQFVPEDLPASVQYYSAATNVEGDAPTDGKEIPVMDGQAQVVRLDVAPGIHGLTWSWG